MEADESRLHPVEPWAQLKLCLLWLGVSSASVLFFGALVDDFLGVLLLLVLLAVVALAAVLVLVRGIRLGWTLRRDTRRALAVCMAFPLALAVFIGVLSPLNRAAHWVHVMGVLITNHADYAQEIAIQERKPRPQREDILVWTYGGWLSDDQDIVWDPLDRPEQRLSHIQGGGDATCSHLMSHYYDCGIWS